MLTKISRLLKNVLIDLYIQGEFLGGNIESVNENVGIYSTVNTDYKVIKAIFFEHYKIKKNDVIIDVGCGKGRVFNYLLYRGIKNDLVGYEINKNVAANTKRNLKKYPNVTIFSEDIFLNFPYNGSVFYLYNPFNAMLVEKFISHILKIKNEIIILYWNLQCKEKFHDDAFTIEKIEIPGSLGFMHQFFLIKKRVSG